MSVDQPNLLKRIFSYHLYLSHSTLKTSADCNL